MLPKVSIIVPVYNVERYLDRCMQSLLSQTLKEIEIILVDDGSPDNCPTMCDDYAKKDLRVKVIHKKNSGLGLSRNIGMKHATGDFIAFVDSDDYVDIRMYEKLIKVADKNKSDAVFCGIKKEIYSGKFIDISEVQKETTYEKEYLSDLMLDFVSGKPFEKKERPLQMSVWHAIYSKDLIFQNELEFKSERIIVSEDLPFQISFFKLAESITFIPDILYTYCYNSSSLSKKYDVDKFFKIKDLFYLLTDLLSYEDVNLYRCNRYLIGLARVFVFQISISKLKRNDKRNSIKRICEDIELQNSILNYRVKYLPYYARLYYILMKYRCVSLLIFLSKLQQVYVSIKSI